MYNRENFLKNISFLMDNQFGFTEMVSTSAEIYGVVREINDALDSS